MMNIFAMVSFDDENKESTWSSAFFGNKDQIIQAVLLEIKQDNFDQLNIHMQYCGEISNDIQKQSLIDLSSAMDCSFEDVSNQAIIESTIKCDQILTFQSQLEYGLEKDLKRY